MKIIKKLAQSRPLVVAVAAVYFGLVGPYAVSATSDFMVIAGIVGAVAIAVWAYSVFLGKEQQQ